MTQGFHDMKTRYHHLHLHLLYTHSLIQKHVHIPSTGGLNNDDGCLCWDNEFLSTFCCLQILRDFGWKTLFLEILETLHLLCAVQLTLVSKELLCDNVKWIYERCASGLM